MNFVILAYRAKVIYKRLGLNHVTDFYAVSDGSFIV